MSLCIVLRNPNGGVMMAADTAVSTEIKNKPYRVVDMADDEKIIEHNGALIFCSGDLEKCERIRTFIRQSAQLNLVRVSEYARKLFGNTTNPNPDGCFDGAKVTTGKDLPALVEFGQGHKFYSYDFHGKGGYMKPRPFTRKTLERLKQSKAHIAALKAGLKRQEVKTQ